jgi:transcriptional regulator with XRE-family HTH domain
MIASDENLIKRRFGERLREIRRTKGISQEELALSCELDRTYIGSVERGERNISLINIHRIAKALSISPKDLME